MDTFVTGDYELSTLVYAFFPYISIQSEPPAHLGIPLPSSNKGYANSPEPLHRLGLYTSCARQNVRGRIIWVQRRAISQHLMLLTQTLTHPRLLTN
mmetsp:Transcript_64340/g.106941  ORF Transcript_64340/g.106941 Transcript_64340/m.106941 type:complete len:96 (-) Transcript_64340:599-886(-)